MDAASFIPALVALVLAAGAAIAVARSRPVLLEKANADVKRRVASVEAEMQEHRAAMTRWRNDMDGVLESVQDTLDAAKRQRAKARAAQQRAEQGQEVEPQPGDIVSLRAAARERGLL